MEEGTLAEWLVRAGDTVKSRDILAEFETNKATMEFEAVDEGTMAVSEGTDSVKLGTVIAILSEDGTEESENIGSDAPPQPQPGHGRARTGSRRSRAIM